MKKRTMENTVANIIRLREVRRKRIAAHTAARSIKDAMLVVPRLEVEAGELPLVEANLSVNFIGSRNQPDNMVPERVKASRPTGIAAIFEGFTEKEMDELRALEPKLLKWIDENSENAARFFADPVGALDLAGINISEKLRRKVSRIRTKSSFVRSELPHATIKKIKVGISIEKDSQKYFK